MTLVLMVSRNAGLSYHEEARAETIEALQQPCARLDQERWRWYIQTTDGEYLEDERAWSRMHKVIKGILRDGRG